MYMKTRHQKTTNETGEYIAPAVSILDIEAETGFATLPILKGSSEIGQLEDGGDLGNY